jgi:hypothetical protein
MNLRVRESSAQIGQGRTCEGGLTAELQLLGGLRGY